MGSPDILRSIYTYCNRRQISCRMAEHLPPVPAEVGAGLPVFTELRRPNGLPEVLKNHLFNASAGSDMLRHLEAEIIAEGDSAAVEGLVVEGDE